MVWHQKQFHDLTTKEWYEIARLRCEIFIVEQNCDYQDLDGYDQMSKHLFLKKNDQIVAYMRLIPSGYFYKEASFGRVIVRKSERGHGYARRLVEKGIEQLQNELGEETIKIQAEAYLRDFYRSFGFEEVSEQYLDYDIWHVDMVLHIGLTDKRGII